MIRSMTGFGEAQVEEDGQAYHLDIRSVNNRYFKASVHVPESLAIFEADIEHLLRDRLTRGSLTVRLHVRDLTAAAALDINIAAIRTYVDRLRTAASEGVPLTIDLATLAALPGVCQPRDLTPQQREQSWQVIARLVDHALGRLLEMRETEGRALAADLETHCRTVAVHLKAVCARAPRVVQEYRSRLTARVRELLAGSNVQLAEADLLKEASIYAERSDISEEISRLEAHLQQFQAAATGTEPAGRKLEFIAQEMLREANTMGSKAGDPEISRDIIEIKAAIDRIKEQILNVE